MPELPEVETTLCGIAPAINQQTIHHTIIRQKKLRWPIPKDLNKQLAGQCIQGIQRRAKYLLIDIPNGTLIIHLGMSGRLRILPQHTAAQKHDHVDIVFDNQKILRYTDPRRFGCILFTKQNPQQHRLLKNLGPEPLTEQFNGDYLYQQSRKRQCPVKNLIMEQKIVVGVGNIYATEALFLSGIAPQRAANKISQPRYQQLAKQIKQVLSKAIKAGGTTLRDFLKADGKPGYFQQALFVYGRDKLPCPICKKTLKRIVLAQRGTTYCPACQK